MPALALGMSRSERSCARSSCRRPGVACCRSSPAPGSRSFKDTSLVSVIAVGELAHTAMQIRSPELPGAGDADRDGGDLLADGLPAGQDSSTGSTGNWRCGNDHTRPRKNADKPPMLVYENVRKRYGTFVAVDGVSLHVNAGEVVCLIGPSGSGKSTLLRCTNALETIDGGEIRFEGKPLPTKDAEIRKIRQRMGMVFQSFELFPHKTALENVAIGLTTVLRRWPTRKRDAALALLDEGGARRQDRQLSREPLRRPAAARGHCPRARHGTGCDAVRRADLGARSRNGRRSAERDAESCGGRHDDDRRHARDELCRRVANWVVVFERGQLLEQGPPQQIFEAPTVERTRDFLSHLGWSG